MLVGVVHRRIRDVEELGNLLASSELLGKPVYCPLCRRELRGWGEGCTILHLICEDCEVELTLANASALDDNCVNDLERRLLDLFYSVSSKW